MTLISMSLILVWYLCFFFSWKSANGFFVPPPAQGHFDHSVAASTFQNTHAVTLWAQATRGRDKSNPHFSDKEKAKNNKATTTRRRKWEESYALLVEFHKEHGHANIPEFYKEDPKLGKWAEKQRRRRFTTDPDKITKLDALNFTWDGAKKEKNDRKWDQMFQCLQEYKEAEGHCCVPNQYKPNQKLANWVYTQRRHNTLGKLKPDRFEKLESIDFVWRLKEFQNLTSSIWEEKWENKFEELLAFRKEQGHCQVPRAYAENPQLAEWVVRQRQWHEKGEIRPDRKQRLDDVGFTWDFEEIFDEAWHKMYNQLIEIKKQQKERDWNNHKGAWASRSKHPEVYPWECDQRASFLRGTINPQREALLAEIGYWESLRSAKCRSENTLKASQQKIN